MAKKLTAGVLQGTAYKETMNVEWNGEQLEVDIRALSNKEATEVESLSKQGIDFKAKPGMKGKMQQSMDFDYKEYFKGLKQSNIKAVALGTTDESLTEDVIENEFPPVLVDQIADRIKDISGIENEEDIDNYNEGEENPSNEGSE